MDEFLFCWFSSSLGKMDLACRIRGVKALWNKWEGPGLPGGHPFMPQKALTPRIGDGGMTGECECVTPVTVNHDH